MSNFYEDASVVMVPSGYKDQKVYSSVPDDGSADLTFSRSNDTATRVGPDGLIEKVRTNLLTYSNDFSNAAWTKAGVTITSGQADPNGGTSAFKIDFASGGNYYIGQFYLGAGSKTNSIWLRADSAVQIGLSNGTDLITGPTLTTSWVRYQAPQTSASSSGGIQIDNYFGVTTPQLAITIYAYQAQLETGDVATDYIETTTSAVSVGPLANIPRLDYSGGANSPSLLLEPQRTNLATYSEQFDNAGWTKVRSSITANNTTSPAGYSDADLLVADTSSNDHFTLRSATASTAQSFSVFAKAGGYNYIFVGADNVTTSGVFFNLTNGTISQNTSTLTAKIEDYGNGWYRCAVSSASWPTVYALIATSANGTELVHTGNGTSGVFLWGAQLEAGAYATSYIPTLSAAVTRGADYSSKTGISSLIGSTEGVLYAEVDVKLLQTSGRILLDVNDNDTTNRALLILSGSNVEGFVQGSTRVSYTLPSAGIYKFAFAYKSGDFALYVNGVQRSTSTDSITFSGMNQLFLGHTFNINDTQPVDGIKSALLFKTRLSNADLETLTTL